MKTVEITSLKIRENFKLSLESGEGLLAFEDIQKILAKLSEVKKTSCIHKGIKYVKNLKRGL